MKVALEMSEMLKLEALPGDALPPIASNATAFAAASEARFVLSAPIDRLVRVPDVEGRADLDLFLTTAARHHPINVGVVPFPSATITRTRDAHVSFLTMAEGTVFTLKGIAHAAGWLEHVKEPPAPYMRRDGKQFFIDTAAFARKTPQPGRYYVYFDGNRVNYYHWWVDHLTKLYSMMQVIDGVPLLPDHREALPRWQSDSFDLVSPAAGYHPEHDGFWQAEEVVTADWAPTPFAGLGCLTALRAHVLRNYAPTTANRRLYIRRSGRRKVENESEIEACLSGFGFVTLDPDRMTVGEQVDQFRQANFIVGPHGAGLTNMLFAPPGAKLLELMPDMTFRPHFWGMTTSLGQGYGLLGCRSTNGTFDGTLDVNVVRLKRLMSGMVNS